MALTDLPTPPRRGAISPNGVILIAVLAGLALALTRLPDPPGALTFLFVLAGWVLSVAIHEFGHAVMAYRAGDHTVAEKGYLSLDPLKYADLGTSLILPLIALALGGIGFPGGAVYLREDLMRDRRGRALASLAGPLGTLLVLVALAAGLALGRAIGGPDNALVHAVAFLAFLQATALILNLLPIPGLDGFGVLAPYLPEAARAKARRLGGLAFLALFGLLFFVPPAAGLFFAGAAGLTEAFGVPGPAIAAGWDSFRFWTALPRG